MKERPFLDNTNKPTEKAIQAALASTYPYYTRVTVLTSSYSQAWTFTKTSGWMLKFYDRRKALLYLIPLNNGFKISLAIRENEREAFLHDDELGIMHDMISSSKKYSEGFALQFDITTKTDFEPIELFIRKLITIRA